MINKQFDNTSFTVEEGVLFGQLEKKLYCKQKNEKGKHVCTLSFMLVLN